MKHTKHIVVGGAGAGGLSVGWGLAEAGYNVVVLEKRPQHCQIQSGPKGGLARRHGGAFYAGLPQIARKIRKKALRLYDIPCAVKQVGAVYYVRKQDRPFIISGWQEAQIPFYEDNSYASILNPDFCKQNEIKAYITFDQIIDTEQLANFLKTNFESSGKLEFVKKVIGSEIHKNEIKAIIAESMEGEKRYPCDLWINVTGAWQHEVELKVNPDAEHLMPNFFGWTATPVWRCPWNWNAGSSKPLIIQFYGIFNLQLLKQLSIIPVAGNHGNSIAGISMADENEVYNPDDFYEPLSLRYQENKKKLENKCHELQDLLSQGLRQNQKTVYNPDSMSWCVKSFLIHPEVKRRGIRIDWGTQLITVIPMYRYFGGVLNSIVASPGKLGSVLDFRDQVVKEVNRYFGIA